MNRQDGGRSPRVTAVVLLAGGVAAGLLAAGLRMGENRSAAGVRDGRETGARAVQTRLPLSFEANLGQTDAAVKYVVRGGGCSVFLTPSETVLALVRKSAGEKAEGRKQKAAGAPRSAVVRMRLAGGNPAARVAGEEKLPGVSHDYTSRDAARWRSDIPHYARVRYQDVYTGVDLVYHGTQGQLEYDFVVQPGADPGRIRMEIAGHERMELDGRGDLVLHTAAGEVRQHRPVVYQEIDGARKEVEGRFLVLAQRPALSAEAPAAAEIGFELGEYDAGHPLVIDPVLSYSTYIGGTMDDLGRGLALDGNKAVLGGTSYSIDYPHGFWLGYLPAAFITKFNATGSSLVFATFYGADVEVYDLISDGGSGGYITGEVNAGGAIAGASSTSFQRSPAGGADAFVARFNYTGAITHATYIGGSDADRGWGLAVSDGGVLVTGSTRSTDFPVRSAFQAAFGGGWEDGFVAKLSSTLSSATYVSYLGGAGDEQGRDVASDNAGSPNAYVTGYTSSPDFPTQNALDNTLGGPQDAFLVKLNQYGVVGYSTYFGGSDFEGAEGVAVDGSKNPYLTGSTMSFDFPTTVGAYDTTFGGADAFVTKFNSAGTALAYSTYLGGHHIPGGDYSSEEAGLAIVLDNSGSAYVAGITRTNLFPTVNPVQATYGGGYEDAFVAQLNAAGSALLFSSYLGGSGREEARGIGVNNGNIFVGGTTDSTNFPVSSALQPTNWGQKDAFVVRISP